MDYLEGCRDIVGKGPSLIVGHVRRFLTNKLLNSHHIRETYYNGIFNIGLFIVFVFIVGCVLLYKYKGKPTPEDKTRKDYENHQFILSTIRNQNLEKMRNQQELITGLPHWDTEYSVKF